MATNEAIRITSEARELFDLIGGVSYRFQRPFTSLRLQALLQLPRIADINGFASFEETDLFLRELATELPRNCEWFVSEVSRDSPRFLNFHEVALEQACDVMARFHYLRSPRLDGRYYGLSSKHGQLVAICVSSPLDVEYLGNLLSNNDRGNVSARVLSRVFAFEGAPRNTISHLLSRAAHAERKLGVTDWVSYVNPNMGFSGISYLASGWHLLGEQPGTTYRYLDNRYITDRELATKFGCHDDDAYNQLLGERFAKNKMQLEPLLVFSRQLAQKNSRDRTNGESKQLHATTSRIKQVNHELKTLIAGR
ncbi:MAG TPA: hypothetical protein VIX17_01675 [Pyrinomonadaceae bacterium]